MNQELGRISVVIDDRTYLIMLDHGKFEDVARFIGHIESVTELPAGYIKFLTLKDMVIPTLEDVRVIHSEDKLTAVTNSGHGTSCIKPATSSPLKNTNLLKLHMKKTEERRQYDANYQKNGYTESTLGVSTLTSAISSSKQRTLQTNATVSGKIELTSPLLSKNDDLGSGNTVSESLANEDSVLNKRKMELLQAFDETVGDNANQGLKRKRHRVRTHRKRKSNTGAGCRVEISQSDSKLYVQSLNGSDSKSAMESVNHCSKCDEDKHGNPCTSCSKTNKHDEQWTESLRNLSAVTDEEQKVYKLINSSLESVLSANEDQPKEYVSADS